LNLHLNFGFKVRVYNDPPVSKKANDFQLQLSNCVLHLQCYKPPTNYAPTTFYAPYNETANSRM